MGILSTIRIKLSEQKSTYLLDQGQGAGNCFLGKFGGDWKYWQIIQLLLGHLVDLIPRNPAQQLSCSEKFFYLADFIQSKSLHSFRGQVYKFSENICFLIAL